MCKQNIIDPVATGIKLPRYSEEDFSKAVSRILQHKQSAIKFQASLCGAHGAVFTGDYALGRISHHYFSECIFQRASLKNVAGSGSIFSNVKFIETDLTHSLFQNSTLEQCRFDACQLDGSNMSECYIQETTWNQCPSGIATMASSYLKSCRFLSTKPGNLAESCLDDVYIENIRLTNINMEFASFKNIRMKDVVLPFSQMPYVFGGLEYLMDTDDSVRISSHINNLHSISLDEYINVLKDMEVFYSYREEYFPLANIMLAFHRYDEALEAILHGIKHTAVQRDFRMCKYYCKMITENGNFSAETLKALYQVLYDATPVYMLSEPQYYQYLQHMPEIKSMLVENPNRYPHMLLTLETNINYQESASISMLLTCLDELIHLDGSFLVNPSITIRHNSPLEFAISLCGTPLGMLAVGALVLSIISNVCKTYNEVAKAIISTQTIFENTQKTELNQLQKKKLSVELAKLELENSELREKLAYQRQKITASGIVIARANVIGQDFNPMKLL